MSSPARDELLAVLDALEEADASNLAWGLTDESWTRDGLAEFIGRHTGAADPEACIDELLAGNLLVQLPREWPTRYRTRMSEAVRLFTRLRQMFPGQPWQSGARLVSDFRFLRRPRAFPERNLQPRKVLAHLREQQLPAAVLTQVERVLAGRDLSRFQLGATSEIFSGLASRTDRGVVVGAGTGSGKTLAFYLPALSQLAAGTEGPRVIAIYPRNELLKDQLATALREIRGLRSAGSRSLVIGAYFGPTPFHSDVEPDTRAGWRRRGSSWICPFLTCPAASNGGSCGGALAWERPARRPADRVNWGHLVCQKCGGRVTPDELLLTRTAMQDQVPDVLFTTTEMLNLQLSDGWSRHVFGVGARAGREANLVLLDEIHTYSGASGAQVGYLLRRWRKLMNHSVTWVGLSATLANAATFFSDLCGLPAELVTDIRPDPDDMKPKGSEYQLLLRGDPASRAALLSTSIQSLMLLRRVLDENESTLDGVYGTRIFAFLENLNLVNRLYRQLLNAEGRTPFGTPDQKGHVLANLRVPEYAGRHAPVGDEAEWDRDGQYWWLPEKLGFGTRSLQVSRTSSQDAGVDQFTDIVVATSSLEVGYDDPRVGAILQHKAPRDIAQFLQRRGRAGRRQDQRPWTVVVFSDYGRDRLAFQSYESIFDPSLPAKSLPLGNQSVRKMQAAMCLIDWITVRLGADGSQRWSARWILARPDGGSIEQIQACLRLLGEVLDGGAAQHELIAFVQSSLGLTQEETQSVCWEYPRSLMLEVVPTAYRRLSSGWSTIRSREVIPGTDIIGRQPLPEFIPSTLFSDLALPEVEIMPPAGYDAAADTSLPAGMVLNELAPGKVTLRWAVQKVSGLWIGVPESGVLDLDAGLAPDGEVVTSVLATDGLVPVVRPVTVHPVKPDGDIRPTSNGWLSWQFSIGPEYGGTELPRPHNGPLGELIPGVAAFLNADRGPLPTWRFALNGTAEIVLRSARQRREYTFAWHGNPAAVGFASTVDALVITIAVPDSISAFQLDSDAGRLRQLRTDRFTALSRQGLEERGLGPFAAAWVADVTLAVAADAVLRGEGIESLSGLDPSQWQSLAETVVNGVLLATTHSEIDETPLRETVLDALGDRSMIQVLQRTIPVLNQDPDPTWLPWIRSRFLQTVAAAWQAAAQQVCLDFNMDSDALVDVLDEGGPRARIVMSDTVPGGGGLVEALTRRLADDPRRFDALVVAAVEPSDSEEVDPSLRRVLELLATSARVAEAARRFRAGVADRLEAWQSLIACLADEGVPRTHANISALSARVFRPGSGTDSDDLLRLALERWDAIDDRAGFAIDHRTVCAFLAEDDQVADMLGRIAAAAEGRDPRARAQLVLLSLLWTRAYARRPETLRAASRFVANPALTERTLLADVLPDGPPGGRRRRRRLAR